VLSASIAKHYCESIAAALSLFLVADGQDSTHSSSIAITILQSNSASLLKHVTMSSNNFIALYRTINHVPGGTNTTEEFGTLRGAVKRHIESTCVTAWDTYLQRQRDNELSLALKKKPRRSSRPKLLKKLLWKLMPSFQQADNNSKTSSNERQKN
jgi:hypothetical protein